MQPEIEKTKEQYFSGEVSIITTNWDCAIDDFADLHGYKYLHLHGDRKKPERILLPSELEEEDYRQNSDRQHLVKFFDYFKRIDRLIFYGISLSPLDAELGILIGEGFEKKSFSKKLVIIDKSPNQVFV